MKINMPYPEEVNTLCYDNPQLLGRAVPVSVCAVLNMCISAICSATSRISVSRFIRYRNILLKRNSRWLRSKQTDEAWSLQFRARPAKPKERPTKGQYLVRTTVLRMTRNQKLYQQVKRKTSSAIISLTLDDKTTLVGMVRLYQYKARTSLLRMVHLGCKGGTSEGAELNSTLMNTELEKKANSWLTRSCKKKEPKGSTTNKPKQKQHQRDGIRDVRIKDDQSVGNIGFVRTGPFHESSSYGGTRAHGKLSSSRRVKEALPGGKRRPTKKGPRDAKQKITHFKYHQRAKLPRNIKRYEGNKDLEDHLGILSAGAEIGRNGSDCNIEGDKMFHQKGWGKGI
ncbi:hypothetical protein Tco_1393512 [Tanacetum coccineum]